MDPLFPMLCLAALVVGLSKGGLASAGTLVVPFLAIWLTPLEAAALMLPIFLVSDAVGVALYRHQFSPRNLAILIPAGLTGTAFGVLISPYISAELFLLLTGVIGLLFCLSAVLSRAKPPRPADLPRGIFWGLVAGITSFVALTGGPPYQAYVLPQRLTRQVFAGTTVITFAALNLAKLPAYGVLGLFETWDFGLMALLATIAICGTYIGKRVVQWLSEVTYRRVILILLFILSLRLVITGAWAALS